MSSSFLKGLIRPSLPALAGILLVATGWFAAFSLLVTESSVAAVKPGYLMRNGLDTLARLSILALRARETPPDRPAIALFGSSNLRHGLTRPAGLHAALADVGPVEVLDFATDGTRVWEWISIADGLHPDFRGVIIFGVNPLALANGSRGIEEMRLAIPAPFHREEMQLLGASPPSVSGNYFLDNFPFYANRCRSLRHLVFGPVYQQRHPLLGEAPAPASARARYVEILGRAGRAYPLHAETTLALLERGIRCLERRKGIEIVLLDTPVNSHLPPPAPTAAFYEEYRRTMAGFATRSGVHWLSVVCDPPLGPEDFHDHCHLNSMDAIRRYTRAVAAGLAPIVRKLGNDQSQRESE